MQVHNAALTLHVWLHAWLHEAPCCDVACLAAVFMLTSAASMLCCCILCLVIRVLTLPFLRHAVLL